MSSIGSELGLTNLSFSSVVPPLVQAGIAGFLSPMIKNMIMKAWPNLDMTGVVGWLVQTAILAFSIYIGGAVARALLQ